MNRKIVVVGGGPGGYVAAIRAAQLGAAVTLIEKESLGGTCLNHGCIPSKIMQTTAKMVRQLNHCDEYGININGAVSIDMAALMSRKDRIIHNQITGIESLLKRNKVTYVRGHGRIKRKGFIEVRSAEDGFREIEWDKLILATGSKTLEVDAFPFDNNKIISSTQALGLETVPESMVIVGGGVIGCELACILSDMGVAITIVEALDRLLPLPSVDRDCSKVLQREMKKRKIRILINKTVTAIDVGGPNTKVTIGPSSFVKKINERDRESIQLKVDKVLICIGRQANTDGLGLEALGVKMDEKGWIQADQKLQTTNDSVYAIGDALGPNKIMLAHVASTEGIIAAENSMGVEHRMNYTAVPSAIFTSPEVANVGLTVDQAKKKNLNFRADSIQFRTIGKAHVIGEIAGEAKIVSDPDSGVVMGVHIIGPHATDLIAEGTLAVATGCTVIDLAETIHAHPTLAEATMLAAFKAMGKSMHS